MLFRSQPILLRVVGEQDLIYSGQTAGFPIKKIEEVIETVSAIEGVEIEGVTSFPCYLFDEAERKIKGTNNLQTIIEAVNILKDHGINPKIVNTPSATCLETLDLMVQDGGNCAEPGHGLTGTTPAHEIYDMEERICIAYLSEVSHNFKHNAYCFGGGHYRRSHMQNAIEIGRAHV